MYLFIQVCMYVCVLNWWQLLLLLLTVMLWQLQTVCLNAPQFGFKLLTAKACDTGTCVRMQTKWVDWWVGGWLVG